MNKKLLLIGAVSLLPLLSGCASAQKAYQALYDWDIRGGQKESDNFRAAPLVVPPDYALEPAPTGMTQQNTTQEQTLDALFGGTAQRPAAERALSTAGGSEAGIRSAVGDPKTLTVNKGLITRDIIAAPEGDGQFAQASIPN